MPKNKLKIPKADKLAEDELNRLRSEHYSVYEHWQREFVSFSNNHSQPGEMTVAAKAELEVIQARRDAHWRMVELLGLHEKVTRGVPPWEPRPERYYGSPRWITESR